MTDGELAYRGNVLIEKELMKEKLIKEELIEKGLIKKEMIEENKRKIDMDGTYDRLQFHKYDSIIYLK